MPDWAGLALRVRRSATAVQALYLLLRCAELYFEAVVVLEVGGVVIWSACVRVMVLEHHGPTVVDRLVSEAINVGSIASVEREVVHAGSPSFVAKANDVGRLLHNDVGR
jgi:hypothetical protein